MRAQIEIACNNPDNGQPVGKSEHITIAFGSDLMQVELSGTPISTWCTKDGFLRVGRRRFKLKGYTYWYGNWCWDMATVSMADALRCFNGLQNMKYWKCDEGPDELYVAFNTRRTVNMQQLMEIAHKETT